MDKKESTAANIGETDTPDVESAPTEETTTEDKVEEPVVEEPTQPVEEEKTVPLSALQKERELRKSAEEESALLKEIKKKGSNVPTVSQETDGLFDEETGKNLNQWYAKKRAEEYATDQAQRSDAFKRKHEEELKDPLLDGAVRKVIQDSNAINIHIEQEDALVIAKKMIETRLKQAEDKAQTTGFTEGQDTARKKTQAGAIGETVKSPPVDDSKMTAAEYRTYHGIPSAD